MITIVHGDDMVKSRGYFLELKTKIVNPIVFDGMRMAVSEIQQALQSNALFFEEKNLFIEDLFKRKSSRELDEIVSNIINATDTTIVLWEGKELTAKQTGLFKKATVKQFKIPQTIWAFLDSIKPGNSKQMITLLHQALTDNDEQFIFAMMVRQVRLLLGIGRKEEGGESNQIDEIKRLAPWQKNKLEKTAALFGAEKLNDLHDKLFAIDLAQKKGNLSMPLSQTIDFLLTDI